jgi:S-(hydroxymethyl)glutathione dehydrogenase/alcohol dehydrogenase
MNRLRGTLYDGETRLFRPDGSPLAMYSMGGLAEYAVVPANGVFPLGDGMPAEESAILGCAAMTAYGAITNGADLRVGERVAVVATGGVGSLIVQLARAQGALQVVAVDVGAEKLEAAQRLGATDLVDATAEPVEQVRALTAGRGADYVLEAAGRTEAMEHAILMAHNTGVVVLTGVETLAAKITLSAIELAVRGKDIRMCQNGRVRYRRDVPRFVELMEQGRIDAKPIISSRYRLDDIMVAYEESYGRRELTGVIVPSMT